jgi:hypothetical protein
MLLVFELWGFWLLGQVLVAMVLVFELWDFLWLVHWLVMMMVYQLWDLLWLVKVIGRIQLLGRGKFLSQCGRAFVGCFPL